MGVTEVSKSVDLPKSTVARLLAALEEEDAVKQDGVRGMYELGEGLSPVSYTHLTLPTTPYV